MEGGKRFFPGEPESCPECQYWDLIEKVHIHVFHNGVLKMVLRNGSSIYKHFPRDQIWLYEQENSIPSSPFPPACLHDRRNSRLEVLWAKEDSSTYTEPNDKVNDFVLVAEPSFCIECGDDDPTSAIVSPFFQVVRDSNVRSTGKTEMGLLVRTHKHLGRSGFWIQEGEYIDHGVEYISCQKQMRKDRKDRQQ